jgi:hypothetical protein
LLDTSRALRPRYPFFSVIAPPKFTSYNKNRFINAK